MSNIRARVVVHHLNGTLEVKAIDHDTNQVTIVTQTLGESDCSWTVNGKHYATTKAFVEAEPSDLVREVMSAIDWYIEVVG